MFHMKMEYRNDLFCKKKSAACRKQTALFSLSQKIVFLLFLLHFVFAQITDIFFRVQEILVDFRSDKEYHHTEIKP